MTATNQRTGTADPASRNGSAGSHYDAIVFGSGAAGLTCATTLQQHGVRTLLAEKNPFLGGYSHGWGRDGYYWDHGGHIFLAYRLGKQARTVFRRLGLDERVEMVPDAHDYRCIFPGESMELPAEMSAASDLMAQRFPAEREGIERVFMTMERMIDEVDMLVPAFRVQDAPGQRRLIDPVLEQFQRPGIGNAMAPLARLTGSPGKTLLRYQTRTFNDLLDEHLEDPLLKAYFSMLCVGIAAAPAELSAVIAGVFFVHSLRTMWMPKGGFGKIGEGLAEMFQEAGGTIETDAEVERVLMKNGRAAGIGTTDGRSFTADAVVCAADAKRLFLEMLPEGAVPGSLRRRLPGMQTTPSFFQVQLGVDMDLEPYREGIKRLNFIYPYPDIDRAMANFPNGNVEEAAYYLYVATFHQPEMAPPGKHSLKLECPTRLDSKGIDWERDKEQIADTFIRRTESIIPGLSQHIEVKEIRTPADLQRDIGNSEGAFAGWAFTPELLTRGRPQQRSPIKGLYLCGHWTTPSAGVPWVMLSGYNTAGMVVADVGAKRRARNAVPGNS